MLDAARSGRLDAVRWLFGTFNDDPDIGLFAPETPRCSTLPLVPSAFDVAAMCGHLHIVKYFHEIAASIGGNDNKKWKRGETRCGTDPGCTTAAMNYAALRCGSVAARYCNRKEGYIKLAVDLAAPNGHLEIVQWLHTHGSEGCTSQAMDLAARGGHLSVRMWLHENTSAGCMTQAMGYVAESGHLDIVKWLHENRDEGCTIDAMNVATQYGKLHVVKWLHKHRTEGCTTAAMDGATESSSFKVI